MTGEGVEFKVVKIHKPEDVNFILGQSHFIKTVEDIAEAVVGSVPGAKFGLAFSESSGDCLIRIDGNDEDLMALARDNAKVIGAGHSFILFLRDCYPINVLNAIKNLSVKCALSIVLQQTLRRLSLPNHSWAGESWGLSTGRSHRELKAPKECRWRTTLLRRFGYKRG